MSFALVFPGQGSQSRGMLAALAARFASVYRALPRHRRHWVMIYGSWSAQSDEQLNAMNSRNRRCWRRHTLARREQEGCCRGQSVATASV